MKKKQINIGFDIGVSSVGWSILDDDTNIIDMGVRLFDDPANPKDGKLGNNERRSSRCQRRRIRRIRTRKDIFVNFLIDKQWIANKDELADLINIDITEFGVDNPVQLKVKALDKKVSKHELIFILFHYLHHRGYFYVTEENLSENEDLLKEEANLFPSKQLLEFYQANNYYKAAKINQSFSAKQWIYEIETLLKKQELSPEFINEYIKIFGLVRKFSEGPGSNKSPTPYGLYRYQNGKVVKIGDNLWDVTVGKCTYFPNEFRGGKHSPVAEIFNLLNDVNNLFLFNDRTKKLDKAVKHKIFEKMCSSFKGAPKVSKKVNLNLKVIKTFLQNSGIDDINETDIYGYRQNKDKKPLFTELSNWFAICKWLVLNKFETKISITDLNLLKKVNDVFCLLAKYQDVQKRLDKLKEVYGDNEHNIQLLKDLKGLSQTHSLSYKAMEQYIQYCLNHLDESINQQQFFSCHLQQGNKTTKNNAKYFKRGLYDDEIISPTTRRAFNQCIAIMNKMLKIYGNKYEINNITFELARDKNSKEERENISNNQKNNEKIIKDICKKYNLSEDNLNSVKRMRLKLWTEQNEFDIYDGKLIPIDDVLSGKDLDIDHIIPISISGMNGMNNKVLTKKSNNHEKSNQTPYQWLNSKGEWISFKDRVLKIYDIKIHKNKIDNLLYELDPLQNIEGFIERNLVDTRYASRVVLNTFQDFFRENSNYPEAKIKVINGSLTNFARYQLFKEGDKPYLHKDRDLYCHHAIDASIVCFLGMNHQIKQLTNNWNEKQKNFRSSLRLDNEKKLLIDDETGEVINILDTWEKSEKISDFGRRLYEYNDLNDVFKNKVKFSRKINNKNNIKLSNETIYSFKWNKDKTSGNIVKYIVLLKEDKNTLDKYFNNQEINTKLLDKLYIYKYDKEFYNDLKTIYNNFNKVNQKTNPFMEYMKTEHNVENPTFVLINNRRVKKLRYESDNKEIDNIIVLNKHNNNAILESLNWLEIRIYKNEDGKYVMIPINQKVLTYSKNKLVVVESKLNDVLSENNIKNKQYIKIVRGSCFLKKDNNRLYYCAGLTSSLLEIKAVFADNSKTEEANSEGRIRLSINQVIKNFYLIDCDVLGNLYNKREIKL